MALVQSQLTGTSAGAGAAMAMALAIAFAPSLPAQTSTAHKFDVSARQGEAGGVYFYDAISISNQTASGELWGSYSETALSEGAVYNGSAASYQAGPGTSNAMIMTMGPNLWTLSYTSALTPGVNFSPAPPFASLSATEAFFTKNITIKEAALQATDILDVQDSSSNPVFQVSAGSDVKMLGAASGGAPSLYIWAGAGSQEWQIQASTASPSTLSITNPVGDGTGAILSTPNLATTNGTIKFGVTGGPDVWDITLVTVLGNSEIAINNLAGSGTPSVLVPSLIDSGGLGIGGLLQVGLTSALLGDVTVGTSGTPANLLVYGTLGANGVVTFAAAGAGAFNVSGAATFADGITITAGGCVGCLAADMMTTDTSQTVTGNKSFTASQNFGPGAVFISGNLSLGFGGSNVPICSSGGVLFAGSNTGGVLTCP